MEKSRSENPDFSLSQLANEALGRAERKQNRIYQQTGIEHVMRDWYLDCLYEEALREILFEQYTQMKCEEQRKMENERPSETDKALTTAKTIITAPSNNYKEVL